MDVDGTLTDGGIYMGKNGELIKKFNVKDGYAIHDILPSMGILPIVITGRNSEMVENRCKELEIKEVVQGSKEKLSDLIVILEKYQIKLEEVAYIGHDRNDLEIMKKVGIRGCPFDAVKEVKSICEFVLSQKGGNGAVRDFVEWLARYDSYKCI